MERVEFFRIGNEKKMIRNTADIMIEKGLLYRLIYYVLILKTRKYAILIDRETQWRKGTWINHNEIGYLCECCLMPVATKPLHSQWLCCAQGNV